MVGVSLDLPLLRDEGRADLDHRGLTRNRLLFFINGFSKRIHPESCFCAATNSGNMLRISFEDLVPLKMAEKLASY